MSDPVVDHPLFYEPPTSTDLIEVVARGVPHDAEMAFYLYQDMFEELWFAAEFEPDKISLGVLTGQYGLGKAGPFIELTGFESITYIDPPPIDTIQDHTPAFSGAIKDIIGQRVTVVDARTPGVVGLFVHAPGCGAHITPEAARLHLTYFNVPFQALVMADCTQGDLGVYARQPRGAFFSAQFHTVSTPQVASTSPDDESA